MGVVATSSRYGAHLGYIASHRRNRTRPASSQRACILTCAPRSVSSFSALLSVKDGHLLHNIEFALGKYVEAGVIAGLILFDATSGLHPGGTRRRGPGGAKEAPGADDTRAPRRRMEQGSGVRDSASRYRHAFAWLPRARRCIAHDWIRHARPVHAHWRIPSCRAGSRLLSKMPRSTRHSTPSAK